MDTSRVDGVKAMKDAAERRFPELRRLHRVLASRGHARRRDVVGQGQSRFEAVVLEALFGEQFIFIKFGLLVIPKIVLLVVLLRGLALEIISVVVGRGLRRLAEAEVAQ